MISKWIILSLAVVLAHCAALAQTPSTVLLKENLEIPIIVEGKSRGTFTLPKGSKLTVRAVKGDNLTLEHSGSLITVLASQTDFGDQTVAIKAQEEKKRRDVEDTQLAEERKIQEQEAKKPQIEYEYAKKYIVQMRQNINRFVGPDIGVARLLIASAEEFVRQYENGDEKTRLAAIATARQRVEKIMENKTVYGYKYNEFLKEETAIPIFFDLFKDMSRFYIKIGDGDICTVVPIDGEDMLGLYKQLIKIINWAQQCKDQKLDVNKDAGSFGGLKLTFVSEDKAESIYVWLRASGPFAEDRILEMQTVRMNMLNVNALRIRMEKAKEIYDQTKKSKENADKLK